MDGTGGRPRQRRATSWPPGGPAHCGSVRTVSGTKALGRAPQGGWRSSAVARFAVPSASVLVALAYLALG